MNRFNLGLGAALLVSAAAVSLVSGEAAPASGAASRTVTITLTNSGKARWSIDGSADKGSLALNYRWRGVLRFRIPGKALQDPTRARFSVASSTTLRASWAGDFAGSKTSAPYNGPYHCRYEGKDVPAKVTATLSTGPARGVLALVLRSTSEEGFLPSKGQGATVDCSSGYGAEGPSHFEPQWLFRDTISDHGEMSSVAAVIALPTRLLPRGSVTRTFPREIGKVNSPFRDRLNWNNVGRLVVKAS